MADIYHYKAIGIDTKNKDAELIKSLLNCIGVNFIIAEDDECECYDDNNIYLSEEYSSLNYFMQYLDSEFLYDEDRVIDNITEYNMYLGYNVFRYEERSKKKPEFETEFAKKLFAILNKLFGETNIIFANCEDYRSQSGEWYAHLEEYRGGISKTTDAGTDLTLDEDMKLKFIKEKIPEDDRPDGLIISKSDSKYDYKAICDFIKENNHDFKEWCNTQCMIKEKNLNESSFEISDKDRNALIEAAESKGFTELAALMQEKLSID